MKKTFCIAFFALLAFQSWSQRWGGGNRDETIFSRSNRGGFFVSPLVEYSNLDAEWSTSVGGGLAFV
ncbi:MAG: hypothetical protein AAB316_20245, partial [Bacteroidota bacterium]